MTLRVRRNTAGYFYFGVSARRASVSRSVLAAFRGTDPNRPICRHLDGNRRNNALDNLAWGTHRDNCADRAYHRHIGTSLRRDDRLFIAVHGLPERAFPELDDIAAAVDALLGPPVERALSYESARLLYGYSCGPGTGDLEKLTAMPVLE